MALGRRRIPDDPPAAGVTFPDFPFPFPATSPTGAGAGVGSVAFLTGLGFGALGFIFQ